MRGDHYIKSWSSTQKNITLSPGEAELVAAVKASCELIGVLQMAQGWGMKHQGSVWVDSLAALGMVKRKGNGKMRHVRIGQLWVQEKEESGELAYHKVAGEGNPADAMTQNLAETILKKRCEAMGMIQPKWPCGCSLA